MAVRINFNITCNTGGEIIKRNLHKTDVGNYTRLTYDYGKVLRKPPCAVVGGGPSTAVSLDILKAWQGDIFAINDTAGYLSDNGISSFLFAIDCSRIPYKIGPLVKGALFASRCHRRQFNLFTKDKIRTFDLAEDYQGGTTGGPTAVCRTPLQLLRMGYTAITYFGCDGSFANLDHTHVSGLQKVAHDNMMFVKVNEIDYLTNASLTVQSEYLSRVLLKYPQYLVCASGGLLRAMMEHPDTWVVSAVTEDLKNQIERKGTKYFPTEFKPEEHKIWQPQPSMT